MDREFLTYLIISIGMILAGFLIKRYFKWAGISNLNKVLGIGVYWLLFYANILLIIGSITFLLSFFILILPFIAEYIF
jgi:hypothetical protein